MLLVAFVVDLLHPLWCYLYIIKGGMGIDGAPLANSTSQCLLCFLLLAYILVLKPHDKVRLQARSAAPPVWGPPPSAATRVLHRLCVYCTLASSRVHWSPIFRCAAGCRPRGMA
jgi:hypothetical protein